jgi:hypothetical protein
VSHDQHGFSIRFASGKANKDILNATRFLIARTDRRSLLDLRRQFESGDLFNDVIANTIVIAAAHRMWPLRDLDNVPHCTFGREDSIWRCRRNGTRRPCNAKNRYRAKNDKTNSDADSPEHVRKVRLNREVR